MVLYKHGTATETVEKYCSIVYTGDEGGNGKGEIEKQPFPLYYYCLTLLPNHSDLISSPSPSLFWVLLGLVDSDLEGRGKTK